MHIVNVACVEDYKEEAKTLEIENKLDFLLVILLGVIFVGFQLSFFNQLSCVSHCLLKLKTIYLLAKALLRVFGNTKTYLLVSKFRLRRNI